MKCRDCIFWSKNEQTEQRSIPVDGGCSNDNFINAADKRRRINTLNYWDNECYEAGFSTGPEFGCIHFKKRTS